MQKIYKIMSTNGEKFQKELSGERLTPLEYADANKKSTNQSVINLITARATHEGLSDSEIDGAQTFFGLVDESNNLEARGIADRQRLDDRYLRQQESLLKGIS